MIKLQILRKHGFYIEEKDIIDAVRHPDRVLRGSRGRLIAQKIYDEKHLIRVIYEVSDENILVVTFYPARRERYEGQV
jgi:hypothetical protein